MATSPSRPPSPPTAYVAIDPYGIGGPGVGRLRYMAKGGVAMDAMAAPMPASAPAAQAAVAVTGEREDDARLNSLGYLGAKKEAQAGAAPPPPDSPIQRAPTSPRPPSGSRTC